MNEIFRSHAETARKPFRWRLTPFRIAAIYALVGALWIIFSDQLLAAAVANPATLTTMQTCKGWFYVLTTAFLLFLLVRHNTTTVQRSEEALRATIESMADAVLVTDCHGKIVDANRATLSLVGLTEKTELLRSLSEFHERLELRYLDGRPVSLSENAIALALKGQTVQGREAILRRADGRDVYVGVSASPISDPATGDVVAAVAVLRDVTEIKRLERLRDEFLSTAAHELKTPVTTIKGYAQLLRRWAPQGHEPREAAAFEAVNRQCDRISRIVQELLEVSRLQLGRLDLHRERFDLGELAAEVQERMQVITLRHRILMHREAKAIVDADRDRIDEVVVNLLENAIKFSPQGGDVEMAVFTRDGEAVLSVADRGVGIPDRSQGHIFERFYRAHEGTPYDFGGMGMGLYISREVVIKHGGKMWFESEEGRGSTFYLSLPLAERSAAHGQR